MLQEMTKRDGSFLLQGIEPIRYGGTISHSIAPTMSHYTSVIGAGHTETILFKLVLSYLYSCSSSKGSKHANECSQPQRPLHVNWPPFIHSVVLFSPSWDFSYTFIF